MKFVDEAEIFVQAGKGGNGCLSFLREKFIEKGGPDGGDGGDGGSLYLVADPALNTLVDFRYQPRYLAQSGASGGKRNRSGSKGVDMEVKVPVGTSIMVAETDEVIGDLVTAGQRLLVAQGGKKGLGNARFKSSINRAPRKTTNGTPGESRRLFLQLKVLADVGLLGLPNAGKSTLIRAISSAKPKVADYPFTTLVPNLGVVRLSNERSFVMADIPGLIPGAADGAGLGIRFLKHLSRSRVLLHLVDVAPYDGSDPALSAAAIIEELEKFSAVLAKKERWLVLNKVDMLPKQDVDEICRNLVSKLDWKNKVFIISALEKRGTKELCEAVMSLIESRNLKISEDEEYRLAEEQQQQQMDYEIRRSIERSRALWREKHKDQQDDEDDFDVDVEYVNE
tara:strand:+ start:79280 stop:80464 length:1185 start_codon:yes stop_codon:yes gene_type:complete